MKLAVSNIAMPSFHHGNIMSAVAELGISGLEVAPSKVWENTESVTFSQVETYRREVEASGLKVIGIHSLFYDQPHLGVFNNHDTRVATLGFLKHLSRLCADLGGTTLVFGSPQARRRNKLPVGEADSIMVAFLKELCDSIRGHGTFILLEALGKNESDYINSLEHVCRIAEQVDSSSMGYHFDAKAASEAGDITPEIMRILGNNLRHVHVNEADFGILGRGVDHAAIGILLREIQYSGYISLEQRMIDPSDIYHPLQLSINILKEFYS